MASGGNEADAVSAADDQETRIAKLEVENGFRQYDETVEAISYYLDPERPLPYARD
jgi:hypothetical protein